MKDYYKIIDNALKSYEEYKPYHQYSIEWICNRIEWCWKFKKISRQQMEESVDRIIVVMQERN